MFEVNKWEKEFIIYFYTQVFRKLFIMYFIKCSIFFRRYDAFVISATKSAKSLSWAENLNSSPITVNNLFKFSAQESDLTLFWRFDKYNIHSDKKLLLQPSHFVFLPKTTFIMPKKYFLAQINSNVRFFSSLVF